MKRNLQLGMICHFAVLVAGMEIAHAQKQVISNRLSVEAGFSVLQVTAGTELAYGNYSAPSFFGNFKQSFALRANATYKIGTWYAVQAGLQTTLFDAWAHPSGWYNGAYCSTYDINLKVLVMTPFRESGFLNRVNLLLGVGPSISSQSMHFISLPYQPTPPTDALNHTTASVLGYSVSGAFRYNFSNRMYGGFAGEVTQYKLDDYLIGDRTLSYVSLTVFVGYKFLLNKRYKFSAE